MKNKFATIALTAILFSSAAAMAKETRAEKFSKYQAFAIESLQKRKPLIDEQIACVTSSTTQKEVKQCAKNARAAIKKIKDEKIAKIKALKDQAKLARDTAKTLGVPKY
ncbi:MAG: hypothetical protein ACJAW3_000583 [Lentimonas sp.]|jgi:hypothetical protein